MSSLEIKAKELQLDVSELKSLGDSAQRSKVKDIISVAARKLETELVVLREQLKREEDANNATADAAKIESKKAEPAVKKITESQLKDYSWDQSEKFVKLYLTGLAGLGGCSNEKIVISFTSESVGVRIGPISDHQAKIFTFSIKKTCHKINPEKSYHKVKSDYLLVFLAKHNPGSDWSHITFAEKAVADTKKKADEPKLDDKADPSAGLMNMMKKMYEEGDDEMKRTIAKAWTEGQDKKGKGGLDGF
eukprot:GFUD01024373.1.p1 GENE.GFUD01024373.1~~GFUD01024373.1.p1  ORF type:complete len:248 (+),score=105.79 GFUD01024373.1:66-809(+)